MINEISFYKSTGFSDYFPANEAACNYFYEGDVSFLSCVLLLNREAGYDQSLEFTLVVEGKDDQIKFNQVYNVSLLKGNDRVAVVLNIADYFDLGTYYVKIYEKDSLAACSRFHYYMDDKALTVMESVLRNIENIRDDIRMVPDKGSIYSKHETLSYYVDIDRYDVVSFSIDDNINYLGNAEKFGIAILLSLLMKMEAVTAFMKMK